MPRCGEPPVKSFGLVFFFIADDADRRMAFGLLKDSAQLTRKTVAKLGMPISSVHRRKKSVEREGVILGYHASLDMAWPAHRHADIHKHQGREAREARRAEGKTRGPPMVHQAAGDRGRFAAHDGGGMGR